MRLWADHIPVVPKLYPDELLSSWVERICVYYNLTESPCSVHGSNLDIDPPSAALAELASLTGTSADELAKHTLAARHPGWQLEWFTSRDSWFARQTDSAAVRTNWAAYCPRCFFDMFSSDCDEYFRCDWGLTYKTICDVHDEPLTHICPHCGMRNAGLTIILSQHGKSEFLCDYCKSPVRRQPDQAPVIDMANHWLAEFEEALTSVLNGQRLTDKWGGPADPAEFLAFMNDTFEFLGWARYPDLRPPIFEKSLGAFEFPREIRGDIEPADLCKCSPRVRRAFLGTVLGAILDPHRFCIANIPNNIDRADWLEFNAKLIRLNISPMCHPKHGRWRDIGLLIPWRDYEMNWLRPRLSRWPKHLAMRVEAEWARREQDEYQAKAEKAEKRAQAEIRHHQQAAMKRGRHKSSSAPCSDQTEKRQASPTPDSGPESVARQSDSDIHPSSTTSGDGGGEFPRFDTMPFPPTEAVTEASPPDGCAATAAWIDQAGDKQAWPASDSNPTLQDFSGKLSQLDPAPVPSVDANDESLPSVVSPEPPVAAPSPLPEVLEHPQAREIDDRFLRLARTILATKEGQRLSTLKGRSMGLAMARLARKALEQQWL